MTRNQITTIKGKHHVSCELSKFITRKVLFDNPSMLYAHMIPSPRYAYMGEYQKAVHFEVPHYIHVIRSV